MDLEYDVEIQEPRKFMFDICIKFNIDNNPYSIIIKNILIKSQIDDEDVFESYGEIDNEPIIDIATDPDNILAFNREPFKVRIMPNKGLSHYNFGIISKLTLINEEYDYIALNKLKAKIDTGKDKELELFKLFKSMIAVGFNFLENYIEKKYVEEKFRKGDGN